MRFFIPSGKIFAAAVLFCSLSGFAQTRICFGTFLNENFAEALAQFFQVSDQNGRVFRSDRISLPSVPPVWKMRFLITTKF